MLMMSIKVLFSATFGRTCKTASKRERQSDITKQGMCTSRRTAALMFTNSSK